MATSQPVPYGRNKAENKEVLDAAVLAVFVADGHVTGEGMKARSSVAERLQDLYADRIVHGKRERPTKAIGIGDLTGQTFPSAVPPAAWDDQPEPRLAADVWANLKGYVFKTAETAQTGALQRLVGKHGLVVCHTEIGSEGVKAVYVTDDPECVRLDLTNPSNAQFDTAAAKAVRVAELAIELMPEHGKAFLRSYDSMAKKAIDRGHDGILLAIESASSNGDGTPPQAAPQAEPQEDAA